MVESGFKPAARLPSNPSLTGSPGTFNAQREESVKSGRRGALGWGARPPRKSRLQLSAGLLFPTLVSPNMSLRRVTRLVTRGTIAWSLACDLHSPPPPRFSRTWVSPLLCSWDSAVTRSPPRTRRESAADAPGGGRGGSARPPLQPGLSQRPWGELRAARRPAPRPPKERPLSGAVWRLCQPSRILPASLEWKITASNFAERSWCQHFN